MYTGLTRLIIHEVAKPLEGFFTGRSKEHEACEIIENLDVELLGRTVLILSKYGIACKRKYKHEITFINGEYLFLSTQLIQAYIYQDEGFRNEVQNTLKNTSKNYEKIDNKLKRVFWLYRKRYMRYDKIKRKFDDRMDRIFGTGIYQSR